MEHLERLDRPVNEGVFTHAHTHTNARTRTRTRTPNTTPSHTLHHTATNTNTHTYIDLAPYTDTPQHHTTAKHNLR